MPSEGLGCLATRSYGCDASSQLLTAHPCHPCLCWEQEHGANSEPQSHPFLYQIGMPREGDALSEVT